MQLGLESCCHCVRSTVALTAAMLFCVCMCLAGKEVLRFPTTQPRPHQQMKDSEQTPSESEATDKPEPNSPASHPPVQSRSHQSEVEHPHFATGTPLPGSRGSPPPSSPPATHHSGRNVGSLANSALEGIRQGNIVAGTEEGETEYHKPQGTYRKHRGMHCEHINFLIPLHPLLVSNLQGPPSDERHASEMVGISLLYPGLVHQVSLPAHPPSVCMCSHHMHCRGLPTLVRGGLHQPLLSFLTNHLLGMGDISLSGVEIFDIIIMYQYYPSLLFIVCCSSCQPEQNLALFSGQAGEGEVSFLLRGPRIRLSGTQWYKWLGVAIT